MKLRRTKREDYSLVHWQRVTSSISAWVPVTRSECIMKRVMGQASKRAHQYSPPLSVNEGQLRFRGTNLKRNIAHFPHHP